MVKLTKEEIKKVIPHREPMLLIDEVTEMSEDRIRARFYLDPNLEFFRGHFPDSPVMPGVLLIEAMAQAADVMLLSKEKYKFKIPYFMGVDRVSFRRKAVPGDTLNIEVKIADEYPDNNVVSCKATVFAEGVVCALGEVTLAMR